MTGYFSFRRILIGANMRHFPFASRKAARRQAVRLLRAKKYMTEHQCVAIATNSGFKYERATGSILV